MGGMTQKLPRSILDVCQNVCISRLRINNVYFSPSSGLLWDFLSSFFTGMLQYNKSFCYLDSKKKKKAGKTTMAHSKDVQTRATHNS